MTTNRLDNIPYRVGSLLVAMVLVTSTAARADETTSGGGWEMSDLSLELRARNATSAYSLPASAELQTLLLNTVDPDRPGIAFRCEKRRLYVLLAVRPVDLEKALREGVRSPRDWELTYRIDDGEAVTEDWVSMANGRLYMARSFASTAAIFRAARDGQSLEVRVKGRDPVRIETPESEDALFDYYIERCDLEPDYDPYPEP